MASYYKLYYSYYSNFQPRSEVSLFNGDGVDQWLHQIECFFIRYQTFPDQKLAVVDHYLTGEALKWYQQWHREMWWRWFQLPKWDEFVRDLKSRFKPPETQQSRAELLDSIWNMCEELKQTVTEMRDSVYMSNLSKLKSHVSSISTSDFCIDNVEEPDPNSENITKKDIVTDSAAHLLDGSTDLIKTFAGCKMDEMQVSSVNPPLHLVIHAEVPSKQTLIDYSSNLLLKTDGCYAILELKSPFVALGNTMSTCSPSACGNVNTSISSYIAISWNLFTSQCDFSWFEKVKLKGFGSDRPPPLPPDIIRNPITYMGLLMEIGNHINWYLRLDDFTIRTICRFSDHSVQPANLSSKENQKPPNMLQFDGSPPSLGLEAAGGEMIVLILWNSTISTKKKQVFSTDSDSQLGVLVQAYECERIGTRDIEMLGKFKLSKTPYAPSRAPPITVCIRGLHVALVDVQSMQSLVLNGILLPRSLSSDILKVTNLQNLKFSWGKVWLDYKSEDMTVMEFEELFLALNNLVKFCIKGVRQKAPEVLIFALPPSKPPDGLFPSKELLSNNCLTAEASIVPWIYIVVPDTDGKGSNHGMLMIDLIENDNLWLLASEYVEKMMGDMDDVRGKGDYVGSIVICIVKNTSQELGILIIDELGLTTETDKSNLPPNMKVIFVRPPAKPPPMFIDEHLRGNRYKRKFVVIVGHFHVKCDSPPISPLVSSYNGPRCPGMRMYSLENIFVAIVKGTFPGLLGIHTKHEWESNRHEYYKAINLIFGEGLLEQLCGRVVYCLLADISNDMKFGSVFLLQRVVMNQSFSFVSKHNEVKMRLKAALLLMGYVTKSPWCHEISDSKDDRHFFEVIGMEDVHLEKEFKFLYVLLHPLCQHVQALLTIARTCSSHMIIFQQKVMMINAICNRFRGWLIIWNLNINVFLFRHTLNIILQVSFSFLEVELLRNKIPRAFMISDLSKALYNLFSQRLVAFKVIIYPVEVWALNSNDKGLFHKLVDDTEVKPEVEAIDCIIDSGREAATLVKGEGMVQGAMNYILQDENGPSIAADGALLNMRCSSFGNLLIAKLVSSPGYVNRIARFSLPRPPEITDLEDKVNFKEGGMLRTRIIENIRGAFVIHATSLV